MISESQARATLLAGEAIADIGQLEPDAKRMLAKNVRAGRVVKFRAPWCGLRKKTFYRMADSLTC